MPDLSEVCELSWGEEGAGQGGGFRGEEDEATGGEERTKESDTVVVDGDPVDGAPRRDLLADEGSFGGVPFLP